MSDKKAFGPSKKPRLFVLLFYSLFFLSLSLICTYTHIPTIYTMAPLDLDTCLDRLYKKQLLAECVVKEICERTKELLMSESNVVHIRAPVTVVGDIHG